MNATPSTLASFASPLVAANQFLKASFGGFAGSGKTKTASDFVIGAYQDMALKAPVLIIDNEKGSRFLIPKFKTAKVPVLLKETAELADVLAAMDYLRKGEIAFLFADSLTKVYYKYVRDYKAKNRVMFMTLQDWGKILPAWQEEFSDRFVDCPGNIVFTGRGGYSYEKEEDETNPETGKVKKGQFVKSGVKMKIAGETPFEPDLNIWMELQQRVGSKGLEVWREAQILKDRNDTASSLDGKVFKNPTYASFQPFVKFLLGVPTGAVKRETHTENLAPGEDYSRYNAKQAREIEMEKIQGVFAKLALGKGAEDQQLKTLIIEKIFGTLSSKEMEKRDAERLQVDRVKLEVFFSGWDMVPDKLAYVKQFDPSKIKGETPFGSIFDDVAPTDENNGSPVGLVVAQIARVVPDYPKGEMNDAQVKFVAAVLGHIYKVKDLAELGDLAPEAITAGVETLGNMIDMTLGIQEHPPKKESKKQKETVA